MRKPPPPQHASLQHFTSLPSVQASSFPPRPWSPTAPGPLPYPLCRVVLCLTWFCCGQDSPLTAQSSHVSVSSTMPAALQPPALLLVVLCESGCSLACPLPCPCVVRLPPSLYTVLLAEPLWLPNRLSSLCGFFDTFCILQWTLRIQNRLHPAELPSLPPWVFSVAHFLRHMYLQEISSGLTVVLSPWFMF